MIERSIDSKIAQKKSQNATIDPIIKIHSKESNHAKESYIEAILDLDISYGMLVSNEDEKLINFVVLEN